MIINPLELTNNLATPFLSKISSFKVSSPLNDITFSQMLLKCASRNDNFNSKMPRHNSSEDESYDSDEYPKLQPNFPAPQARILSDLSFEIFSWEKLTRGRSHEIHPLQASLGRSYIARFSRFVEWPSSTLGRDRRGWDRHHPYPN